MADTPIPVIVSFSPDTSIVAGNDITDADVLTLTGTAAANTTVDVFDGVTLLGTAAVNSSGAWSFTTGTLANGVQSFTATDTNAAGNTSAASPAFVVTVDTVMPPTPTITSWSPDSVNNVDYGVTNSSYLTLTGTAEANDTVNVFDNGTEIGTAAVNSSGAWTFSTGVIPNGINAFTVSDTDAAGSTSWPSYNPTYVVVDASTPLANPLVGGAQIGVMMDGAEASWVGYPSASDLDYLKSHGVDLVRLPIAWELMQNTLNGPLNATYLSGLENFLTEAAARGMQVIVDLQNYGGYDPNWQQWAATNNYGNFSSAIDLGQPIGSSAVPISSFVNFWTQLATALSGHAGLAGYDLMNEPQNLPNSTVWPTAAQEAVNAIRAVDMNSTIYVEGQEWSAASTWSLPWYSQTLNIVDPANKIVYEAHQYFDANSSGTYSQPFNSQTDYTNLGADLIQPFLSWLQANNDQGLIGEFGVPTTDPQWLPMLNAFMNSLQENNIPGIYTNYMYDSSTDPSWVPPSGGIAIDPDIGQGAAVMELIFEHTAPTIAGFVPTNGTGSSGTTTANILTLTGTGASYNTVNIYDNAALIGTTTSDITGAWSFTTGTLASGTNNFTATNIDAAGNSSEISYTLTVTVNSAAPTAPTIVSFSPDSGTVGDDITNATTLTLTGTATANSTVEVFDGSTELGTAAVNASGAWSFVTGTLANGSHVFTATDTVAGDVSAASTVLTVTVDTVAPTVSSVAASGSGITSGAGDLDAGHVVTLTLSLSEAVTVAGGTPTLTLNDGGTATYTGGSGTSALTFSYTVAAGQNTPDLTVTAVNLNSATVTDGAGNAANLSGAVTNPAGTLQIDTTAPVVSSVVTSGSGITSGAGDLDAGHVVTLTLSLSEAVTVAGGTPTLTLNDGGTATYTGGSGTSALTFSYTVAAGQNTPDLTVTAVNLNSATVTDGAGNAANLSGAVTNPAGTLQIDTTAPVVSSVVTSGSGITSGAGDLDAGHVVTLTLSLSEAVTVAGGTPTLTLNDGGTATYTGGSGTSALTFSYTVAAGQNTPDLTVTAVNLNSATVTDGAGNAANLSGAVTNPAGTLQIDTTAPVVSSVVTSGSGITSGAGDLDAGHVVTLTLSLSEAVTVAGGTPTLTLNDGGTATYTGGSGTSALTFSYTVAAGQNTPDLTVTAVNLNSATVTDGAGNAANLSGAVTNPAGTLQIDTTAPAAPVIASDIINSNNSVTFSGTAEAGSTVTVYDGTTSLGTTTANASGAWSFTTGTLASGTQTFSATATDAAGNTSASSNAIDPIIGQIAAPTIVSFSPDSGTVGDDITNATTLTLTGTATANSTVEVFDGSTELGTAAVNASGAWSFVTGTLANGSHVFTATDTVAGDVSAASTVLTVTVDTVAPTVSSVAASGSGITSGAGDLDAGHVVTLTLSLSEAVTVAGGTPTLTLNDGGTATYTGGSGTSALTFSYTVAAGQNTPDLTVTAVNLNSATVTDGAGNAANLSGAVTNPAGTLQIDTTAPVVSSVVTSGSGITSGAGDLDAGHVVTLTLSLSEAVTVAGGTPTLTLNDGGTATYTGGSGTSALTFSYTVAAGQNTPDLTVTAVNLNSATVTDGAGNAANLSGAVTNPAGTLQIDTTAPAAPVIASENVIGNRVILTGTAGVGSIVSIYDGTTLVGTTSSNAKRAWVFETPAERNGAYTFTATATDAAGNTSASSNAIDPIIGGEPAVSAAPIEVGNQFYVYNNSGSSVALTFVGADVAAGEFGGWVPIGAVQTASGYDVAWEVPGANEYTIWTVDSNGNYLSNDGVLSGTSYMLESYETIFNQDLNDDGTIGLTTTVIQTDGSTSLTEVANQYYLYNGSGVGPMLQYAGADVVAGEFGGWVPIGAVQTAGGYDVAWEIPSANEYTIWTVDSNGNYLSSDGVLSGSSTTLESFAPVFGQDLNGGGVTGVPTVIQTDGSTSLTAVWYDYFLDNSGGSGPELKLNGADIVAGELGGWVPIGAVQTASGYDVAWEVPGANEYTIWTVDSNGNYLASDGVLSGSSTTLESFAPVFGQDLNGGGVTGVPTVIQTDGSTSLTAVWYDYFLDNSGGSGPELKLNGADIVAGEFGGWVPIGAVQTASGYDVAWEIPGANEYSIWTVDSNGNYLSTDGVLSGSSTTLESFAPVFGQDLNGGGVTGVPTVIQADTGSFGSTSLTAVWFNYFLDNSSGSGPELKLNGADIVAGELGGWVPIGAVQTASGYDVAWEVPGANEYSIWTVDSNGNYLASDGVLSGNSYALETLEATFGQDLNGDGVIGLYAAPGTTLQISEALAGPSGSTTIGAAATLELAAADSASVTFSGSTGTLILGDPSTFSGEIFNFTGNGSLSGSDQIDLKGIKYNSVEDSYANGVLTVTDGTDTVRLDFNGSYTLANFDFASDGSGGTIVYDPPVPASNGSTPNSTASEPPIGATEGSTTIGTGATLELAAAVSGSVTFAGSTGTLSLDQPSTFTGTVSGFQGQDIIDLPGIAFGANTTLGYLPNSNQTGGTLTLTNATHSANIALLGNYMASSFAIVSDTSGGTMVVTEASPASNQSLLTSPHA